MLEDGHRCGVEFIDERAGGIDIQEVVVAYFLTVELAELCVEIAVEAGLLVRVLTITKRFRTIHGHTKSGELAGLGSGEGAEPVADSRVICRTYGEGTERKELSFLFGGGGTVGRQDTLKNAILGTRGNDGHFGMVLGGSADKRDAADIDFLDYVGFGGSGGNGILERIEVHNHKVDGADGVFRHVGGVALEGRTAKDAAEDFGMQGFHSSSQNGGISGEALNGRAGNSETFDELATAAGGQEFHAFAVQTAYYGFESVLVIDGNQSFAYGLESRHRGIIC